MVLACTVLKGLSTCQRKSRGIEGVEELNRVYVRVVTIDLVYAHMNGLFSRESKKIRLS